MASATRLVALKALTAIASIESPIPVDGGKGNLYSKGKQVELIFNSKQVCEIVGCDSIWLNEILRNRKGKCEDKQGPLFSPTWPAYKSGCSHQFTLKDVIKISQIFALVHIGFRNKKASDLVQYIMP